MTRNWQVDSEQPPLPDDGWWAAIMREDEIFHSGAARGGGHPSPTLTDTQAHDEIYGTASATVRTSTPLADWDRVRQLYERDETVELEVTGYNRGGVLTTYNSLQGFVPSSHLLGIPSQLSEDERKQALAEKIGQRLRLKVIEHDPSKGRVVFSERAALAGPGSRRQLLTRLVPGDRVDGVVTNVCDFGAFVDLGGLEGLIHVSEVSWGRVAHPRDVLHYNQHIQVSVLSVDKDNSRVALSLKRLNPDPWAQVEERYQVGQVITGTVTNVVNFGAFIGVEEGLEGLVHVSELADGHFMHPRNVVQEGEQVQARITHIDRIGRRLGLSLRQINADQPMDD